MKTDITLGRAVASHLRNMGVETPLLSTSPNDETKKALIQEHVAHIMTILGLDLKDDSLSDTPARVSKMYVDEIFYGLNYNHFPKCTAIENKMHYDEMVVERNINVQSNCEHHLVVISGRATVAYIPNSKVIGLSKINRIVEFFSKRPQVQERLTEQIFHALSFILDTPNVAVYIEAEHYCVKSRGIKDTGSSTVTTKLGGVFRDDPTVRNEFLSYK